MGGRGPRAQGASDRSAPGEAGGDARVTGGSRTRQRYLRTRDPYPCTSPCPPLRRGRRRVDGRNCGGAPRSVWDLQSERLVVLLRVEREKFSRGLWPVGEGRGRRSRSSVVTRLRQRTTSQLVGAAPGKTTDRAEWGEVVWSTGRNEGKGS